MIYLPNTNRLMFHVKHRTHAVALCARSKPSKFAGQLEHSSSALEFSRDGFARSHPMPASQRVVQICLFLVAAIGLFGGTL